jgi:hypothetical protein
MKRSKRYAAAALWIAIAVLIRLYASGGGDASIAGSLLFLLWTAPFGLIWQFWIYDTALALSTPVVVQVIGDVFSIAAGVALWFFILPSVRRYQRAKTANKE